MQERPGKFGCASRRCRPPLVEPGFVGTSLVPIGPGLALGSPLSPWQRLYLSGEGMVMGNGLVYEQSGAFYFTEPINAPAFVGPGGVLGSTGPAGPTGPTGQDGLWSEGTGGAIYYVGGNVGVGTSDPAARLDVENGSLKVGPVYLSGLLSPPAIVLSYTGASVPVAVYAGNLTSPALASGSVSIGHNAGVSASTTDCVAIGREAGSSNSANSLTAVGTFAGQGNSGTNLSAYGSFSGFENTGNRVTAIGNDVAFRNSGDNVTGVGAGCLNNNRGANAVGVGLNSSNRNQGNSAVGVGASACDTNGGDFAVGIGSAACLRNTGTNAVGIGRFACNENLGSEVVGIGSNACRFNTGSNVVAFGTSSCQRNSGSHIVSVGPQTLVSNTGDNNISIGDHTSLSSYGTQNTIVSTPSAAVTLTGSNVSCLGYGSANYLSLAADTSDSVVLGNDQVQNLYCQATSITTPSDARMKRLVRPLEAGLDFIREVPVRTYEYEGGGRRRTGIVAQEVLEAERRHLGEHDVSIIDTGNPNRYTARPHDLLFPALVAIQQLAEQVDSLKAEIRELKRAR